MNFDLENKWWLYKGMAWNANPKLMSACCRRRAGGSIDVSDDWIWLLLLHEHNTCHFNQIIWQLFVNAGPKALFYLPESCSAIPNLASILSVMSTSKARCCYCFPKVARQLIMDSVGLVEWGKFVCPCLVACNISVLVSSPSDKLLHK